MISIHQCSLGARRHPRGDTPPTCDAFPTRIPDDIRYGRSDHRLPVDGDQGLLFDPAPELGDAFAARLRDTRVPIA